MSAPRFTIAESRVVPGQLHYAKDEQPIALCGVVVHRHHGVAGEVRCRGCIALKELVEAAYQAYQSRMTD